jgi:hypothetical protein
MKKDAMLRALPDMAIVLLNPTITHKHREEDMLYATILALLCVRKV